MVSDILYAGNLRNRAGAENAEKWRNSVMDLSRQVMMIFNMHSRRSGRE